MPSPTLLRNSARGLAAGSAGLLIQDKFHGLALGDWRVVAWVVLIGALLALLVTEEALRQRRYTLHAGRRGGVPAIWAEAPEKTGGGKRRLRKRALAAERGIRGLLAEHKRNDPGRSPHWTTTPDWHSLSEEERTKHFWAEAQKSSDHSNELMIQYGQSYASEALALCEQFEQRGVADAQERFRFEHPTNPLGVEHVALCLGAWARKL